MAKAAVNSKGYAGGRYGMGFALALDVRGFNKMVEAVDAKHRTPALKKAMYSAGSVVLNKVRGNYRALKPQSDLWQGIVPFMYPSGEGVGVRRYYIKGGQGKNYDRQGAQYRAYILNFVEQGATDRQTKGKGRVRRGPRYSGLYRGSIPKTQFFRKGWTGSRERAFKEMERVLLKKIADLARKGAE